MAQTTWNQIKDIFQDALDLPTAERLDFARSKSGDDEDLLFAVKNLLESYDEADDFIERPTVAVSHFLTDAPKNSLIGQKIGAYEIESEIGRGGMGAVYLAFRADAEFEKKVAVKLIKRGLDTDEIIERFRNERQILAALDHLFITRLIDGGATSDGLPYLVMDYVEGEPLTKYAEAKNLTINERLRLFLQICSAVAYAHRNLIIHRDLKPSNILVTKDGTPRLLDFGIAKLIADEVNDETTQKTLTRVMTPEYASPEQIQGKQITTASDVYSLGVILYELLTGERPYKVKSKNAEEISKIITESEPQKPSSVISAKLKVESSKLNSQNPQFAIRIPKLLKGDLDNIVLMAMRKESERRYSSVEQFSGDIERFLSGMPVLAQEDTFSYRASKFIGRNKTGVVAVSGVALSLIGGIIAASRQSRIAKKERDTARRETRKAKRINQFLQKMLASADPSEYGKDATVLEALQAAAERIENEFNDQPEIKADLQTTIGKTYLNLGQAEKAEPFLNSAWEIRRENLPEHSEEIAVSLNNLGLLYRAKGELLAAEPLFLKSLKILRGLFGENNEKIAEVLNNLGYLLLLQGRHNDSIEIYEQEIEICRKLYGENHPTTAMAMSHLADCYRIMGEYKNTEKFYREALKIIRKHYPPTHPDVIEVSAALSGVLLRTDQNEAEELIIEILKIKEKVYGRQTAKYAWALYDYAFLMNNQERFAEAEKLASEIVSLRKKFIAEEHPLISAGLQMLAIAFMGQNQIAKAEPLLRESLALREKTLPADHWILDTSKSILGECLAKNEKMEEAEKLLTDSFKNLKLKLDENHEQVRNAAARIKKLEKPSLK